MTKPTTYPSIVILGRLDPEVITRTLAEANAALDEAGVGKLEFSVIGDRFLLDWREQRELVQAGRGLADLGRLPGWSAGLVEQVAAHGVATWRRFLREVIEPRFDNEHK